MTWVEQWICIYYCIKLEHSSVKTIRLIQKATAMGNWRLAASSQPYTSSCITSCIIFGETSNHPGDSALLQPRFGTLRLLVFPKTKITFEKEEISDHPCGSGKYNRTADGYWENCVGSQGTYFEGDWAVIFPCTMFLVPCIFFTKCQFFILHGWIPSGQILKVNSWLFYCILTFYPIKCCYICL